MINLLIFFIFLIFFLNIHGICLTFKSYHKESEINNCTLALSTEKGYKKCFRCYINEIMTSYHEIQLNNSCSPIPENHCVDLYFNTTISYENFSKQYNFLINQLFDKENRTIPGKQNNLFIHIEYDTLEILSLDTIRAFDEVKNRNYSGLALELKNRDQQITLQLNKNLQNMTLMSFQISIYCGLKGLYQYNYIPCLKECHLRESLTCEIPITTTTTTTTILSTTKNTQYKLIIYSLIGGGSLIPCFILTCLLYILCKRNIENLNDDDDYYYYEQDDSLNNSISSEMSSIS